MFCFFPLFSVSCLFSVCVCVYACCRPAWGHGSARTALSTPHPAARALPPSGQHRQTADLNHRRRPNKTNLDLILNAAHPLHLLLSSPPPLSLICCSLPLAPLLLLLLRPPSSIPPSPPPQHHAELREHHSTTGKPANLSRSGRSGEGGA